MLATILFWVFGVVAVAAAVAVFRTDSMARASYALAVSFVAVGGIVVQVRLDYVGLIVVLMMVMEMAIMAVFMVMFMGMNPALMPMDMTHDKRRSIVFSVGVFVLLAAAALLIPWPARTGAPPADAIESLGSTIMGSKMLVMLTISPVLFATIVSALVLANPRGRYDRYGDDLDRRVPDDPQPGGVGR
jgi:NADH:ubiquinone oxidoreductase subunit 6 (subunit J)